ncbi:MAG: tRNA pseudouridine(13) synthase TruD [Candidatus Ranarchaeia archaeon]
MITPPELEVEIGLECFSTKCNGIGGLIKQDFEDFQVIELLDKNLRVTDIKDKNEKGPFTIVLVKKTNLETNVVNKIIGKYLGISSDRVSYAGNKDKRAITYQLFSIYGYPSKPLFEIDDNRLEILDIWRQTKPVTLGSHWGNHFKIRINKIQSIIEEATNSISEFVSEVNKNALPNFFGHQRFGVQRPITAKVGEALLKSSAKEAIWIYLTYSTDLENENSRIAREKFKKEKDFSEAYVFFPNNLHYERQIIKYLIENPDDYMGSLSIFQKYQKQIFIHAYQSLLFNKALSCRLKLGLSINKPIEGDFVAGFDHRNMLTKMITKVTSKNIEIVNKAIEREKVVILGPIIGYNSIFPDNSWGESIHSILEKEKIDLDLFNSPHLEDMRNKGTWRQIHFSPKQLNSKISKNDKGISVDLSFDLSKGIYATVLLREIMKTDPINYV